MSDAFFLVAKIYLGIGCAFSAWLVILSIFQLDKFDWKKLHRLEATGALLFAVIGWPLLIAHRPKSITSARALIPVDYRSAAFLRESDRISKNPPYCAAYISYVQHENGIKTAKYLLRADELSKVIEKPIKRYWVAQPNNEAISSWLKSANLADETPINVPWVWTNFPILVDEMLTQGFGKVHCVACQKEFDASALSSSKQPVPDGGTAHKRLCPKWHVVLNYRSNLPHVK